MSCERPFLVLNPRYRNLSEKEIRDYALETFGLARPPDEFVECPCGTCKGCEKSKQYEFSMRLQYELASHPPDSSLFVTLTFTDEALEEHINDLNRPVLRFLDVLRKRYGKQLRHWFVCEFGSLLGRPHFHGILFGCPPELIDAFDPSRVGYHSILSPLWKHGISFVGYVNADTCKYVSKYVTKSLNAGIKRPRLISSFGIGKSYISEHGFDHKNRDGLDPLMTVSGKPMPLPRYYHNKIFNTSDRKELALERWKEGKWYWQGVEYSTKEERDAARRRTLSSNIRNGLTVQKGVKRNRRRRKLSVLETTKQFKTDFDL